MVIQILLYVGVIVLAAEGLVRPSVGLGNLFNTPSFLWGLTVIAMASGRSLTIATSLPDAFVSIKAARRGESVISLANALGSNIFDLLIAIPAGVLIAGTTTIDFAITAPLMGVLTLATIVLFALLRTGLVLKQSECWVLLGLYGVFIGWMALETLGLSNLIL